MTMKKEITKKTKPKTTTTKKVTTKKATTKKPTKVEKAPVISKAEELCKNVSPELRAQAITLANTVLTLQAKIEQQTPTYKTEPLTIEVTLGSGETVKRSNPFVQEYRATVRDYATALNNLQDVLNIKGTASEGSPIEALRSRFKVG